MGKSPACHIWMADAVSHMPCHARAVLSCGCEKLLSEQHGCGMPWAQHGHSMACVNQKRPHCVNQMGKIQSKPSVTRHGHGMVCVN
jgi:hypothetical protein